MAARSFLMFFAGIAIAIAIPALGQYESRFHAVTEEKYYTNAFREMQEKGVVLGYEDGSLGPDDVMTRAQGVTMLQRYDQAAVQPLSDEIAALRGERNWSSQGSSEGHFMCGPYRLGESFPSSDGCNTCTCTEIGIACTERACADPSPAPAPSPSPGNKCLSSDDCRISEYCTTEDGDCQSACEPG